MIDYFMPSTKNLAQVQIASVLSPSGDTIQLSTGNASTLPRGAKGSATSLGTSSTLNSTGIGALVQVGDPIRNITDGSRAWVVTTDTNLITTTPLIGGSDNLWQSADEWVIGSFYATLSKKDETGEDTTREVIQVLYVDSSTDQVKIETREIEGLATSFAPDDYLTVYVLSQQIEQTSRALGDLQGRKAEDTEVIKKSIGTTKGDVITFTSPSTPAKLSAGSDGQVLIADSSEALGLRWGAQIAETEFTDSTFKIKDNGDNTKKVAFEVSGITTDTTRTITVPDASGTLALTSDLTDLPPKSVSGSSTINNPNNSVTITHNLGRTPKLAIISCYLTLNGSTSGDMVTGTNVVFPSIVCPGFGVIVSAGLDYATWLACSSASTTQLTFNISRFGSNNSNVSFNYVILA